MDLCHNVFTYATRNGICSAQVKSFDFNPEMGPGNKQPMLWFELVEDANVRATTRSRLHWRFQLEVFSTKTPI